MNAYSGCMIGNPAVIMIADAYAKGIRDFDLNRAYRYSVNTCERYGNGDRGWSYIADPDDHSGTSYGSAPFVISNTLENGFRNGASRVLPQHWDIPRTRPATPTGRKATGISGMILSGGSGRAGQTDHGSHGPAKAGSNNSTARWKATLTSKAGSYLTISPAW
jgi:hypothetical protein